MTESPAGNNSADATSPISQQHHRAARPGQKASSKPQRPKLQPYGSVLERSGVLVVDKPAGMTSHDVVAKLRGIMGTKRVGHSGTLDPMATGLLLIGVERGTKFLGHVVAHDKRYEATVRLGAATVTDDAEGEVIAAPDPSDVAARLSDMSDKQIRNAFATQTGEIMQRPAAVSAIKVNGRRAHELVRAGEQVEIPARPVTVFSLEITDGPRRTDEGFIDVKIAVHCSSGTFIRSIARDVGESLGVGGHLTALRRTSVGPFDISEARTLEQLQASRNEDERTYSRQDNGLKSRATLSLTLDGAMARCFPTRSITEEEARKLSLGQWLEPAGIKGVYAAITDDGRAIALLKEKGKRAATEFVARPDTLS